MSEPTSSQKGKGKGKGKAQPALQPDEPKKTAAPKTRAQYTEALICESTISGPYVGGSFTGEWNWGERKRADSLPDGLGSDVLVTVCSVSRADSTPYDGFLLEFCLGLNNETTGFGVRYEPDSDVKDHSWIKVATTYKILVSSF
jgi:hypothetical protein